MKLASILSVSSIILDMNARTKDEAFHEIASYVSCTKKCCHHDAVYSAIKERERQQSTYLGHHVLMPHARVEGLNDFIVICGRSREGITTQETAEKIHFVILLISSKTKASMMLQTMGAWATIFSNKMLMQDLLQVNKPEDFISLIEKTGAEVKKTLSAKDIMNPNVITVTPQNTLHDIIALLFEHNVSGVPVVDAQKKMLGVVTEADIIKFGIPNYMSLMDNVAFLSDFEPFEEIFKKEDTVLVKDIYSKEYVFVHDEVSVIQLAFLFVTKKCRRIVVLDEENRLLGIIMRKDLIRKVINA